MAAAIRGFSANLAGEDRGGGAHREHEGARHAVRLEARLAAARGAEAGGAPQVVGVGAPRGDGHALLPALGEGAPRRVAEALPAYTKSIGGSGSAKSIGRASGSQLTEDAIEMDMSEFKDFVEECSLETREIDFAQMTIQFTKANAVEHGAGRAGTDGRTVSGAAPATPARPPPAVHPSAHAYPRFPLSLRVDRRRRCAYPALRLRPSSPPPSPPLPSRPRRRNASGKANEAKKKDPSKVKGTNDGGEAKMDKELVLYEFINLLVRIAFQRANPTYGNFGKQARGRLPPGCLEEMITTCILPNVRGATRRPSSRRR